MPPIPRHLSARIVRIKPPDSEALYQDLIALAEMARRGEITGVAYSALTPCGRSRQGLIGRARADLFRSLAGAVKLMRSISDMTSD